MARGGDAPGCPPPRPRPRRRCALSARLLLMAVLVFLAAPGPPAAAAVPARARPPRGAREKPPHASARPLTLAADHATAAGGAVVHGDAASGGAAEGDAVAALSAGQLFGLFHRSANVTTTENAALRQLRRHRGQSFAAALLDSRAPDASSYIIDVKREALTYRVDVARRNCAFARRVAQQWLGEAYLSLGTANRTAVRACLRTRVWSNGTSATGNGDGGGGGPGVPSHTATDPGARYFSTMLRPPPSDDGTDDDGAIARAVPSAAAAVAAKAAAGEAGASAVNRFDEAELRLREASDHAADLWSVLHNDPPPHSLPRPSPLPVPGGTRGNDNSNHNSSSSNNNSNSSSSSSDTSNRDSTNSSGGRRPGADAGSEYNATSEYLHYRDGVEQKMDAAARVYESILRDMDHCTQRVELVDEVSQTALEVAKLAVEEAVARTRGEASVLNTVNYNVSLARAWVAIAMQQRRFLRQDLRDELERLRRDVLAGVLDSIRDLVLKRKRALAESARAVGHASRQRQLDARSDLDSWTVCTHIICSNLRGVPRSGCIYGCSGALEDGFSQRLFQVDQKAFDYTCGVYCRGIEDQALGETVRRGYADPSVLVTPPSSGGGDGNGGGRAPDPTRAVAPGYNRSRSSHPSRSLWLGSCVDSCLRAYQVRQTDLKAGHANASARVNALGGLHCAYLKDSLTANGTQEGRPAAPTMTCGDLLTALDPANIGGAAFGLPATNRSTA